jgi:predicted metal-dependent hydrolase
MKSINIPDIGEIKIIRNKRLKRLSISVNKNRTVKLNIPYRISLFEGQKFLFEKLDWIKKNLEEIGPQQQTLLDSSFELKTHSRLLQIQSSDNIRYKLQLTNEKIIIYIPNSIEIYQPNYQALLKNLIIKGLKIEAKEYLPQRVLYLANKHGFTFKTVKVRNSKTRWGSCSYNNIINLSLNLILLPDNLIDYVILHELTHTIHKNHGKQFWEDLEKSSGDCKLKSKELKAYRPNPILNN